MLHRFGSTTSSNGSRALGKFKMRDNASTTRNGYTILSGEAVKGDPEALSFFGQHT